MPTSEELRSEARSADDAARRVGAGPDRQWLVAKAAALRQQADRQEQISHRPRPR